MKSWMKKAAGIVFTDGKSILLMKRAGEGEHIGTWALPGGKAKDGETEIGNAIREVKEETGLNSIPGYRFDSASNKEGTHKFTTFFYRVTKPFDVTLSSEHSEFKWVDVDKVESMDLHPKVRKSMPEYIGKIRHKTTSFREYVENREQLNEFAMTPQQNQTLDAVQAAMDVAGVADVSGVTDGVNGVIYLLRAAADREHWPQHVLDATISFVSIIPFADLAKLLRAHKLTKPIAAATRLGGRQLQTYAKGQRVARSAAGMAQYGMQPPAQ